MERRLAAIMAADVVDYSRLMGDDEEGTLAALLSFRVDLFNPTVSGYKGRVIKSMGDGWLAEFPTVAGAVNCAIEVQQQLAGMISSSCAWALISGMLPLTKRMRTAFA